MLVNFGWFLEVVRYLMCVRNVWGGLGQEGVCLHEGGELSEIPLKGWNRKEGRENKDLKKGASWVKGWVS